MIFPLAFGLATLFCKLLTSLGDVLEVIKNILLKIVDHFSILVGYFSVGVEVFFFLKKKKKNLAIDINRRIHNTMPLTH